MTTMKQVLDGANSIRAIANHPNMPVDEKLAAIKNAIEVLRNDIQDVASTHYENYSTTDDSNVDPSQIDEVYEALKTADIADLKAYYTVQTFERIAEATARAELAKILISIAVNNNTTVPATWQQIANSGGIIVKEAL